MTAKPSVAPGVPAKNTWTEQQTVAVKTRGVSVSLSAGAGCGKTFVLTERFLDCFALGNDESLPPDDLHQLVAITFTERAAREMRDRVRRKCYAALEREGADDREHWAALLRGLDSARISTIHSFCGTLLRSHAVEAGVDPQFEVLEQSQSEALLSEAVDDELRQRVSERDERTIELAGRFDLPGLRSMVQDLAVQGTLEDFEHWLTAGPDEQVKAWENYHRQVVIPRVVKRVVESEAARQIVEVLRAHGSTNSAMRGRCEALKELLPALATQAGDPATCLESLRAIRENAKVQGGGTGKNWDDADAYATFRDAATNLRDTIGKVESVAAFDPADAREAAEVGGRLLEIAAGVRRRYEARKLDLAALDFDDLLVRARRLLVHPDQADLRQRVGKQIRLLLVDEFQDTDRVQVELVEALCGEALGGGKLFFVGDYKQSIYRFRGADPHVFGQLREATPPAGRLSLTRNFRSQPAILEFVNALFWHDLGADYEPLRAHRVQATARPAVEFIWVPPDDPAVKENADAMRRREAEWIARRIRAMLDGAEPLVGDGDTARAVQPGDVAILFRALSDVDLYEEQLRRHGIDYYLVGGHAFYAQQEIFDLLNLLRAVASPGDEVSLIGALRSGFFALSDDTIYWLATRTGGLPAALRSETPSEIVDPDQRQRVARARATLAHLVQQRDRLRICELIELALSLTGYDAALLAEFLGERKLANLRKVIEQARTFERNAAFGLTEFLAELAEFVARQPKEPLAATFSEDTRVVRLMTIHQAKGLEFPVVFVPDLGRPTELRTDRVHLDRQLGPLVQLPERADGERPAGGYALWRVLEEEESLAEMNRLLYVATTRAADYLVLCSGLKSQGEVKGAWMNLLAKRFDLASGRFIGQLPPGEVRPTVRVTMEKPPLTGKTVGRARSVDLAKLIAEVRAANPSLWSGAAAIEPIAPDLSARRQYSFSRLSGKLREGAVVETDDSSGSPATVDPRGLGTLVHAVLATIDFAAPGDWRSTVSLFAERHLPPDSAEVEEAEQLVAGFLKSPRAGQMAQASRMFAEAEFWLSVSDHDPHGPPLLLTGYLDRLYQDAAGKWHVVDFKTNRVTAKTMPRVAADYEMQMLVYALATERILGEAPASLTLHFLRGGLEQSFAWDDAARERATEQIRAGIARVLTSVAS